MESNLNIKTSKLNIETVSSAVFGKEEGGSDIKGGSGESIRNIHKTLSKLSGHVRKALVRIKALEGKFSEVETKLVTNTEKIERIVKIQKILENKKSYLKDLKQSIDEFEKTEGKAEFFNSVGVRDVELEKEKWKMGDEKFDKLVTEARDYIQSLEEAIQDEQEKLDSA